jgi:hypothetical protein
LGHAGLLLAYRLGRTASVAPFFYCFALWGVVSGLVIWGELPNALALTGIALIAGSGVAIVVLDQRRGRKEVALADVSPLGGLGGKHIELDETKHRRDGGSSS